MTTQPVIDLLRDEHRVMQAMFAVIDEEMEAFSTGGAADFERLLAAVEYCHAYPGARHHPKEDIVFGFLQERDPDAAEKMGDLAAEHKILGNYTRRFKSAIERVLRQENIDKEQLSALANDYATFLRRHMRTEETVIFPAALAALTAADWQDVGDQIAALGADTPDPATEARFEKLRDTIASTDG
ncbi:MAG: hemerythrin domain-containing protein [Rhodospirillales bacterium]